MSQYWIVHVDPFKGYHIDDAFRFVGYERVCAKIPSE